MLVMGVATPIVVLVRYWINLGPVSHEPQDWSAFGSVMAGSFTFLAAVSTTATLLILIKQKSDSDKVVADQLAALRFEQYVKHRSLFMERLDALELRFNKKFLFLERDHLYRRLFPTNSAASMSYSAGHTLIEFVEGLDDVWEAVSTLPREPSIEKAEEVCRALLSLFHKLGVEWQGSGEEGDVSLRGNYVGLNLFAIPSGLSRVDYILESLVHFGGDELGHPRAKFSPFGTIELRDKLYDVVLDSGEATVRFKAHLDNRLHDFYDLYIYLRDTMHGGQKAFLNVFGIVRDVIDGQHGCEYLTCSEKMLPVLARCLLVLSYQEIDGIEESGGPDFETANEKIRSLMSKIKRSVEG